MYCSTSQTMKGLVTFGLISSLSVAFAGSGEKVQSDAQLKAKLNGQAVVAPAGKLTNSAGLLSNWAPASNEAARKYAGQTNGGPVVVDRGVPANDECEGAIALACNGGALTFSNVGAATGMTASCSFGGQLVNSTVWFSFVAGDIDARVSTCGGIGITDTVIVVYSGACGGLTEIACNDDFCGLLSEVCATGLTVGETYYVEVGGWNLTAQGDFNISILCPCSPDCVVCEPGDVPEGEPDCFDFYVDATNGGCNSAPPVFGTLAIGDTVCATAGTFLGLLPDPNDPNGGIVVNFRDTDWFEFTVAGPDPELVTWSVTAEFPVLNFILSAGCPPTLLTPAATAGECGTASNTICLVPGTYVAFAAPSVFTGVACGAQYRGSLTSEPCPPPPAEDECEGAVPIPCDGTVVAGDNSFALLGAGDDGVPCAFGGAPEGKTVWHSFVATQAAAVISLCNGSGTLTDSTMTVHDGVCGALTQIGCNDDTCGLLSEVAVGGLTVGNTYYVRVGSWNNGAGGTYGISATCLEPVTNDECETAIPVACGSSDVYSNVGASAADTFSSCSFGGAPVNSDVWFSVVAADKAISASTCGLVGIGDTVVSIYDGACGALTEIACNDDACGLLSTATALGVTVGNTYYVRVAGWDATAQGAFALTITCFTPPTNDVCADAIGVTPGTPVNGTTIGTTIDTDIFTGTCGTTISGPGVWYTVVGNGNQYTASTCSAGTDYDTKLNVFCGTCPTFFACVTGNDDDPNCGFNGLFSTVSWCTAPGQTYYILVQGFGGASGNFELTVSDTANPCVDPVSCVPPPPVANDDCADAISVAIGSSTLGTTLGATNGTELSLPFCGTGVTAPGVWYVVNGDGNTITVTTCNDAGTYDTKLNVYCGTCDAMTCVGGNDDGGTADCFAPSVGANFESRVTFCSQNGAVYYILVQGFGGGQGDFQLDVISDGIACVATVQCVATGACCVAPAPTCIITTEANCGVLGGQYQGDGSNCGGGGYSASSGANPVEDISGTGTASTAGGCDDACSENVVLPFGFNFFGTTFNDVWINANGFLSFGAASGDFSNDPIPNALTPNNIICPLWDDFNGLTQGDVYYQSLTSPDRFVVMYSNMIRFGAASGGNTFEVILYADGSIEFRYGSLEDALLSETAGIEDAAGATGLATTAASDTSTLISNLVIPNPCEDLGCPLPGCVDPGADCDFDSDCDVDLTDLAILLANFGTPTGMTNATGDTDGDGDVDLTDLANVLARFGNVCHT